jgi:hypothetical protein
MVLLERALRPATVFADRNAYPNPGNMKGSIIPIHSLFPIP